MIEQNRIELIVVLSMFVMLGLGCWSGAPKRAAAEETTPAVYDPPDPSPRAHSNASDRINANSMENEIKKKGFEANLPVGFAKPTDDAGRLLLKEYGAVFVARGGVTPPATVVFKDQAAVSAFQSSLRISKQFIGGFDLELQSDAMNALRTAIDEATAAGKSISPRDKDSARRSYDETIALWASRVDPALKHWISRGRITQAQADRLKSLTPFEQVPEVLNLEAQGIWFAKDLSKSIIYSVAPPGTSQHLSMLAFDVKEHEDAKVREILANHGWFQTVVSDLPHFTFLGVNRSELSNLGLRERTSNGRTFWVPE